MGLKGGYTKRLLDVDLSDESVRVRELSDDLLLKFIGGRGLGAKFVWDFFREKINSVPARREVFREEALKPDNIILIAPGPLTGLYFPAAGKTSMSSISPATGIYADSNFGGMFGVELKQAGYDALLIRGAARRLKYIFVNDDEVRFIDASSLRGKGCVETERAVKKDIGDEEVRVACIGPAGENKVRFACVNSEWGRNAGRTGMGAVFGAKNLKAIAVRGSKDLAVHDIDRLLRVAERAFEYLQNHFLFDLWQEQGLMSVVDYLNTVGVLPSFNFRAGVFRNAERINGEEMVRRFKIGNTSCFACPMACGNICLVKEGRFRGTVVEGPEYETTCMFSSNMGVDDFSFVVRANYLCDELGMDTISTGNIIAALIEAQEKSIITEEDVGFSIKWGEKDKVLSLIEMIARRRGIGDVLAEGSFGIIRKWKHMESVISHVKYLEQSAYDAHASECMALAYGTCDIGAHHNRAWPIAKELEVGQKWGIHEKVDIVLYHQAVRPLFDMLGVCRLPWIELGLPEKYYADAFSATTGVETSIEELLFRSNAVYNLTRAVAVLLGIRKNDDYPPKKVFEEPLQNGPNAGKRISKERYEKMLLTYYEKRGWDEKGIPRKETLEKFGLNDVAEVIEKCIGSSHSAESAESCGESCDKKQNAVHGNSC
ncbi:MAG: aldehyde ferredoxin oxidoreductase family protein [Canidatus Methanoxibalbensis ujae]|nr:aldehyde ferredoxin oxidoreductase family protein [Candidatus Methanoxibalbensis ujae]